MKPFPGFDNVMFHFLTSPLPTLTTITKRVSYKSAIMASVSFQARVPLRNKKFVAVAYKNWSLKGN